MRLFQKHANDADLRAFETASLCIFIRGINEDRRHFGNKNK